MNSQLIYRDIKFNSAKSSYNHLKKKYLLLIKNKYTVNNSLAEAEDRFSSSYLKLYEKIKSDEIRHIDNLNAYFLVICKNSFLLELNKKMIYNSNECHENKLEYTNLKTELKTPLEIVRILLNVLPEKLKKVSELIYIEGMNHREIAATLNMNYNNVRKYHYKAIRFLRSVTPIYFKDYIQMV